MPVDTEHLPPRYRHSRRIARGAMGDVYLATDDLLGREVAVKVLGDRYALDEGIRRRFKREALTAARLSGEPGAVTIFDVGEWHERPFIVMEHLGGGSLEDVLRREGAQPPERALGWLDQAAAALDAAHGHGIVHRDVKPANLLLDGDGRLHVADFGIASAAGLDSLTLTGTVLGTAGYISPEQARGERAAPPSDLYSLAVVAYELLSGRRPFESDSATAEAAAHVHAPVPPIGDGLPPELDGVFRRALAKDPEARYGSGRELVAELRHALAPRGGTAATAVLAPARATRRRPGPSPLRYLLPLALLVAAAAVGAILAAVLTSGGSGPSVVTRTIAGPAGTATVTVTRQTTAAAPAPAPPPPPPPPPAAAGGDGHTLNDQGFSLMQQGSYAAALPLLQQSVQKLAGTGPADPYEGYANYNLGYTLFRLGRCPEAVAYLKRAEHLEPDRSEPRAVRKQAQHC